MISVTTQPSKGSPQKPQQEALQAFLETPKAVASWGTKFIDSGLHTIDRLTKTEPFRRFITQSAPHTESQLFKVDSIIGLGNASVIRRHVISQ